MVRYASWLRTEYEDVFFFIGIVRLLAYGDRLLRRLRPLPAAAPRNDPRGWERRDKVRRQHRLTLSPSFMKRRNHGEPAKGDANRGSGVISQ